MSEPAGLVLQFGVQSKFFPWGKEDTIVECAADSQNKEFGLVWHLLWWKTDENAYFVYGAILSYGKLLVLAEQKITKLRHLIKAVLIEPDVPPEILVYLDLLLVCLERNLFVESLRVRNSMLEFGWPVVEVTPVAALEIENTFCSNHTQVYLELFLIIVTLNPDLLEIDDTFWRFTIIILRFTLIIF